MMAPAPAFLVVLALVLLAAGGWAWRQDRREGRRQTPEPRMWVLVGACALGAVWTGGHPVAAAAALLAASMACIGAGAWSLARRRDNLGLAMRCFAVGTVCSALAGVALPA